MSEELKPWHDCPACPKCQSTVGTPARLEEPGRWYGPADATLFCPACGAGWVGSAAELEQAERAQAAWDSCEERIGRKEASA